MASPHIQVAFSEAKRMAPCSVLACGLAAVARLCHRIDVRAAGVEGRIHVGHQGLDQLEFADGPTELLALMHIGQHHIKAGGHQPQGAAGEHQGARNPDPT